MFGISLAGTGAGVLAFFILLPHFFKENALLRFSVKYWQPSYMISVLKLGFSATVATISVIVRTFILNWILLSVAISGAVAAFSIIQSLSMFFTLLIMSITMAVLPVNVSFL